MNLLFITIQEINCIEKRGVYTDLVRLFLKNGHNVTILTPVKEKQIKEIIRYPNLYIKKVISQKYQKKNKISKGLVLLTLDYKYIEAYKKINNKSNFDLVLYSTPPITINRTLAYIKKNNNCLMYLLLKDIFPQNAIDLNMFSRKSLIAKYYCYKEKKVYMLSDVIGCMSARNVEFLLNNNSYLSSKKIEVCPNSIELTSLKFCKNNVSSIHNKYSIPSEKVLFLYGGNLGKPQGIDFLIKSIDSAKEVEDAYFIIIGSGTEYDKLNNYFEESKPSNAKLMQSLPKLDYELLVNICDVGLIYLDNRFTIPNFPSRLLSYLQAGIPILSSTDVSTDVGSISVKNGFGMWNLSGDLCKFVKNVEYLCNEENRIRMGKNARKYLEQNYTSKHTYDIIMKHFS